jgi:hypothetical protein
LLAIASKLEVKQLEEITQALDELNFKTKIKKYLLGEK